MTSNAIGRPASHCFLTQLPKVLAFVKMVLIVIQLFLVFTVIIFRFSVISVISLVDIVYKHDKVNIQKT